MLTLGAARFASILPPPLHHKRTPPPSPRHHHHTQKMCMFHLHVLLQTVACYWSEVLINIALPKPGNQCVFILSEVFVSLGHVTEP